jgi:hypothetical protein
MGSAAISDEHEPKSDAARREGGNEAAAPECFVIRMRRYNQDFSAFGKACQPLMYHCA